MPVVFCIAVFKTLSYSCFVKIFTLLQVCKVPFALKFQILTVLFYLNSKDCATYASLSCFLFAGFPFLQNHSDQKIKHVSSFTFLLAYKLILPTLNMIKV